MDGMVHTYHHAAPPEHMACTRCHQFASIGGLFAAARDVLDGTVTPPDCGLKTTPRDREWTSLRGRGRRTAALRAELAWAKQTRAIPPEPLCGREFSVSRAALRELIGYTLWWLKHLRRQPQGGTAPHVAHVGIPAWMRAMEQKARLALAAPAQRWRMLQATVARTLVGDTLGLKPRTGQQALGDRAWARIKFRARLLQDHPLVNATRFTIT
jgi:hypothetical protein